jgi:hypothetical protein
VTAPIPPDVTEQLRQLIRRELQAYVSSAPSRHLSSGPLSITEGQVRMSYPEEQGGGTAVYFGPLYSQTTGEYTGSGLLVTAPDGTNVAEFYFSTGFDQPLARIYDASENVVIGTDAASGQGIARPYLSGGGWGRARYADWTTWTASTTFETLHMTRIRKQQPRLEVGVRASSDGAAVAGELRVLVNGVPLGATQAVGFAAAYYRFGPAAVAGADLVDLDVEIQARRTSAAGAIRVEPWYPPLGQQS